MLLEDYAAYKAGVHLWKIIPPILITFGTIGNVLTIIVLTKNKSRRSSTHLFLSALAFSDLLALYTGALRQWITYTFDVDVRVDLSVSGCRFHWFIVYVVTQFSSWMLICLTTERVFSTWLPHRRSSACTPKSAIIMIATIAAFLIFLNSHYLFGYGMVKTTSNNVTEMSKCVPMTGKYDEFVVYTWTWIDLCVFYLIPMFVMILGNAAIIYKVYISQRRSRRTINTTNIAISTVANTITVETQQSKQKNKASSLTITLMMVSAIFFICITPIVVLPIGDPYWQANASAHKKAVLFLLDTIANIMMYVNHSINFALYFLSGTIFRNDVKRLLCQRYSVNTAMNETVNSRAIRSSNQS